MKGSRVYSVGRVVRRAVSVCASLVVVCVAQAVGQPSEGEFELGGMTYAIEVARHRGFEAVRWSRVPASLAAGSFQTDGTATATVAGAALELRVGSPFGRHGETVLQLSNVPYLESGEVWVPFELFTGWLPRAAAATETAPVERASPEPAVSVAGVDLRPTPGLRRPGPWRVVIDAGHGGVDPGTISPRTGAKEKDITLAVSRKLAEELRRRDRVEPLLTRDGDVFVEVMKRPGMAVDMEADLFISIHVDAQPGRRTSARGFTTFHLGQARTDDALEVARRENAVIELETGAEPPNLEKLEIILATVDRDAYRRESRLLAGHIQNALRGALDSKDRGAKQGPYYVLMTPGLLPAVLVELGFITNGADEVQLTDSARQDRIARSLADTIEAYFEDAGRRMAATEGRG